uniref:Protochlorophyllide reductase n=1 Tax=Hanusia phi TaxID=3032 RepID=A0A7S0I4K2_9CRYP
MATKDEVIELKLIVVTGGNRGIGKAIVEGLWKSGKFRIILACRDESQGERAKNEIKTKIGGGEITVLQLDLCCFESIKNFSKRVKSLNSPLFALVNNAGILRWRGWHMTKDGFEQHLQANHLGHFLLVKELESLLLSQRGSRVIAVGSNLMKYSKINWNNLNDMEGFGAYGQSKLCNFLHMLHLHNEYSQSLDLKAMTVDPGEVNTDITRYFPFSSLINFILKRIPERFTPEEGADTIVYCCLCDDESAKNFSGNFLRERKIVRLQSRDGISFFASMVLAALCVRKLASDTNSDSARRLYELSHKLVSNEIVLPPRVRASGMWKLLVMAVAVGAAVVSLYLKASG